MKFDPFNTSHRQVIRRFIRQSVSLDLQVEDQTEEQSNERRRRDPVFRRRATYDRSNAPPEAILEESCHKNA